MKPKADKGGWYSAKDLTDHSEPVIYARPKGDGRWAVGIAYWTVSQRWFPEIESTRAPRGFTKWKPLGAPPESER